MPDDQPTRPFRQPARPRRTKLLIVVGLVLVAIVVLAPRACVGERISEEEAVANALAALEAAPDAFVPAKTEAKLLQQGFPAELMWVVLFTVPDPEGDPDDFLHHAAVYVKADDGEVRQVRVTTLGGG